ncbi:MAG: hypothetical protein ACXACC_09245 [Promethearchaeota archaeon]|jgi:ribosome biogenesis protein Nip4
MLEDFIQQFSKISIPYKQIGNRFYLKNKRLDKIRLPMLDPNLFGCYLGEIKNKSFHPSFNLLDLLSDYSEEKIHVNDHGEIDFLYGKHIRKKHIISIKGSTKKNRLKLVQNKHDENLGYGMFIGISENKAQILKHILDRGVFIKRDKQQK